MEQILLCRSLEVLDAVGEAVGIPFFQRPLHPHVHGEGVGLVHTEKQSTHSHLRAHALDGHKRFLSVGKGKGGNSGEVQLPGGEL